MFFCSFLLIQINNGHIFIYLCSDLIGQLPPDTLIIPYLAHKRRSDAPDALTSVLAQKSTFTWIIRPSERAPLHAKNFAAPVFTLLRAQVAAKPAHARAAQQQAFNNQDPWAGLLLIAAGVAWPTPRTPTYPASSRFLRSMSTMSAHQKIGIYALIEDPKTLIVNKNIS